MIDIYLPSNTNFTANGDMTLEPIKAELEPNLNGPWIYKLEHPIDDLGRWKYIQDGAVIKAPSFNGVQMFRIKHSIENEDIIEAEAEPIFLDAKDEIFITNKRLTNLNGVNALREILRGKAPYTSVSDLTEKRTSAYYTYTNAIEAISGEEDNSFLNRWGGEVLYNNYTIQVLQRVGEDNGVEIRYGKNIPVRGFTEEIDYRDIATRVYPKAYNGKTMRNNGYVDSPIIDKYPVLYTKTITYSNVKMVEDAQEEDFNNGTIICYSQSDLDAALTSQVRQDYARGLDKPSVVITAEMVLLKDVIGYEDYEELVDVSLGDTVHCYHSKLGIITDTRVTSLVYNSLTEKVDAVKLTVSGQTYDYFKTLTQVMQQTRTAFANGANGTFLLGDKNVTITKGVITEIQ